MVNRDFCSQNANFDENPPFFVKFSLLDMSAGRMKPNKVVHSQIHTFPITSYVPDLAPPWAVSGPSLTTLRSIILLKIGVEAWLTPR